MLTAGDLSRWKLGAEATPQALPQSPLCRRSDLKAEFQPRRCDEETAPRTSHDCAGRRLNCCRRRRREKMTPHSSYCGIEKQVSLPRGPCWSPKRPTLPPGRGATAVLPVCGNGGHGCTSRVYGLWQGKTRSWGATLRKINRTGLGTRSKSNNMTLLVRFFTRFFAICYYWTTP